MAGSSIKLRSRTEGQKRSETYLRRSSSLTFRIHTPSLQGWSCGCLSYALSHADQFLTHLHNIPWLLQSSVEKFTRFGSQNCLAYAGSIWITEPTSCLNFLRTHGIMEICGKINQLECPGNETGTLLELSLKQAVLSVVMVCWLLVITPSSSRCLQMNCFYEFALVTSHVFKSD